MIIFVYGTTAEAIKLAPIVRRLNERGIPHQHWLTFQHTEALRKLMPVLGLPQPDLVIADGARGKPLRTRGDVLIWLGSVSWWTLRNLFTLRKTLPKNSVLIVHGDTMTSVVGAILAKLIGKPSAHVEAGLRSGNWRHPFPEELDRRIVGGLAQVHYTPSPEATQNLKGKSGIVFTHGNTVIDAVLDGQKSVSKNPSQTGVVLLHRFEFISNKEFVEQTLSVLTQRSPVPLSFVVDVYSRDNIENALNNFPEAGHKVVSKLAHQDFVELLGNAAFVVTDSGGIQEETALIGVPTIVHRVATERQEGIGRNVLLSGWDLDVLGEFLVDHDNYRKPQLKPEQSPSDIIVEDLINRGFAT